MGDWVLSQARPHGLPRIIAVHPSWEFILTVLKASAPEAAHDYDEKPLTGFEYPACGPAEVRFFIVRQE